MPAHLHFFFPCSTFTCKTRRSPAASPISNTRPDFISTRCEPTPRKFNENVLIGIDSVEPPGEKIGVRLIAGLIARRIVPWISENDAVQRGERVSLIQFGSRVDVYLPLRNAKIKVKLGDKVIGGETVIASFD